MLHSAKEIIGRHIGAIDGDIGRVRDLYFDDQSWMVRYLVADLGNWLPGRQVLLSPAAAGGLREDRKHILVQLTRQQISDSPDASTDIPVSRQHEAQLAAYYGWPTYWAIPPYAGEPYATPVAAQTPEQQALHDPHLRSFDEVHGYRISTRDGEIGHVVDLFLDPDWVIRFLEVSTRTWLHGKKVLVPRRWVVDISWEMRVVGVDMTAEQIRDLPVYTPGMSTEQYEEQIRRSYQDVG